MRKARNCIKSKAYKRGANLSWVKKEQSIGHKLEYPINGIKSPNVAIPLTTSPLQQKPHTNYHNIKIYSRYKHVGSGSTANLIR